MSANFFNRFGYNNVNRTFCKIERFISYSFYRRRYRYFFKITPYLIHQFFSPFLLRCPTLRSLLSWRNRRPRRFLTLASSHTVSARDVTCCFHISFSFYICKSLPLEGKVAELRRGRMRCCHSFIPPHQSAPPTASPQGEAFSCTIIFLQIAPPTSVKDRRLYRRVLKSKTSAYSFS